MTKKQMRAEQDRNVMQSYKKEWRRTTE